MTMYDDKELELIICGLGEINADDWAANTEYVSRAASIHTPCLVGLTLPRW